MLCSFSVKNFKGFKDKITLDLSASNYEFNAECIRDKYVNIALIYGYNGVGKSNLGTAIMDIIIHLTDKMKDTIILTGNYANAESSDDLVEFTYNFNFLNTIITYYYGKRQPNSPVYEHFFIGDKKVLSYNRETNEPLVINLAGTENLNKNLELIDISLLKYIKSNTVITNARESEIINKFFSFVDGMLLFWNLDTRRYAGYKNGIDDIIDGIMRQGHLDHYKSMLNDAGLPFNISYQKLGNKGRFFFEFQDEKKNQKLIDFWETCSSGTRALTLFYYWLQYIIDVKNPPSMVFIDEFDAFYHQSLAQFVVKQLKEIHNCQFILTTHDTSLMSTDLLRPDCLFLMHPDRITSVTNSTGKELRKAHNIEKIYRAGL